jgi:hypothetical protein
MGFIFSQPATGWRAGCWLIFGKIRPQEKSVIFRRPELRCAGLEGPTGNLGTRTAGPYIHVFVHVPVQLYRAWDWLQLAHGRNSQ